MNKNFMVDGYIVYIKVKLHEAGFHRWAESDGFLRNWHRHLFGIKVTINVDKSRGIEFFDLQNEAKEIIRLYKKDQWNLLNVDANQFYDETSVLVSSNPLVIGSCEDFATYILAKMEDIYGSDSSISVEVSEDDENSAVAANF